jgi:peroxiredoxin
MAHRSHISPHLQEGPAGAGTQPPKEQRTAQRRTRTTRAPGFLPRVFVLAVTLTLLIGVVALVRAYSSTATTASVSAPADTQTTSASSTRLQASTPDFTLATLGGGSFHLAAQRGHVVVLYFMATSCGSCAQGSHDLAQALLSAKTAGAQAVAIDVNPADSAADLQEFVQAVGVPATAPIRWGIDATGTITNAYRVPALETTVVIDKHGQIAYRQDGAVPPEQLAQIMRNLA